MDSNEHLIALPVGMPSATEDIGNWLEPLGLASLFIEGVTAAVSVYALTDRRAAAAAGSQSRRTLQAACVGTARPSDGLLAAGEHAARKAPAAPGRPRRC